MPHFDPAVWTGSIRYDGTPNNVTVAGHAACRPSMNKAGTRPVRLGWLHALGVQQSATLAMQTQSKQWKQISNDACMKTERTAATWWCARLAERCAFFGGVGQRVCVVVIGRTLCLGAGATSALRQATPAGEQNNQNRQHHARKAAACARTSTGDSERHGLAIPALQHDERSAPTFASHSLLQACPRGEGLV